MPRTSTPCPPALRGGGSSSTVMPASSYRTVKLVLDILQGMGVSTAAGVRPFLPTLLVGALAADDLGVDFDAHRLRLPGEPVVPGRDGRGSRGHHGAPRAPRDAGRRGGARRASAWGWGRCSSPGRSTTTTRTWWPGIIGGLVCALIAQQGTHSLLTRTRARLDAAAAAAPLPLRRRRRAAHQRPRGPHPAGERRSSSASSSGCALGGRRREGEKHAGLRILR